MAPKSTTKPAEGYFALTAGTAADGEINEMHKMHNRKALCAAIAAALLLNEAPSAAAQGQGTMALEEVVVSAQRRQQSLQDVPISVTAFSAEQLQRGNIGQARDYLLQTPNVAFSDDGQAGSRSVNISIRGVTNFSLGEVSTANSIGFYIDELNVATVTNGTINPQLQDMERIEVLRGPQGTYFGRNSLGGAINISTKLPTDEFYGEITGSAANYGTYGGQAILNVPISDKVMIRGVYAYEESDSWIDNTIPGNDLGYEHNTGRIALRAMPTDEFTIDLSVTYTDENEGGDIQVPSGVANLDTQSIFGSSFVPINEVGFYPENDDKASRDLAETNDNEFTIVNLRLNYDFDGFALRSITGMVDSATKRAFDQDNISTDTLRRFNDYEGESFSQELRLQSTGTDGMRWVVGAFYADDEIKQFNSIQSGAEGSYTDPATGEVIGLLPPIPAGFRINENRPTFKVTSYAVFGEVSYPFNDDWELTVGARYSEDEIDNTFAGVVAFESLVPDASGSSSFDDFSPKVSLSYQPTDSLHLYASASKGYKAGGIDLLSGGATSDFDAEELMSYEIGVKSEFADGRVRLGASVFALEWDDLQVQANFLEDPTDISSAVQRTLNAAEATASGAEIEVSALLTDGLQGSFSLGYLDTEFDSFPDALIQGSSTPIDLSGAELPRSPELTANAAIEYSHSFSDGLSGYMRVEWSYRDEVASNLEAVASRQGLLSLPEFPYQIDSYQVFNIRAGISGNSFRINAFIENALDEDYYTGTGDGFGLSGIRVRPNPMMYGVSLTYFTGN
ncbi:MAG: TonB-dependent receptor [Pseudomonadales bacterium]